MLKYVVSVWLWVNYKNSFERAFAKDGRIDIDPECIWLVNVTIDLAVASLLAEATENIRVGRSFRQDSKENKKLMEGKKLSLQPGVVAIRIATLVSRKLMLHLCLDSDMVSRQIIYKFLGVRDHFIYNEKYYNLNNVHVFNK